MINPLSGDGLDNFSEDMTKNGFNSLQSCISYGFAE